MVPWMPFQVRSNPEPRIARAPKGSDDIHLSQESDPRWFFHLPTVAVDTIDQVGQSLVHYYPLRAVTLDNFSPPRST
jgi:hypothetical protein